MLGQADHTLSMYILGGVAAGIVAGTTALWRILTYLAHRFADEENGIATKWVERQGEFYDGLLDRFDKQQAIAAKQQELCDEHGDEIRVLDKRFPCAERFETVRTNEGVKQILHTLKMQLANDDITEDRRKECLAHIDEVISELASHAAVCQVCGHKEEDHAS